MKIFQFIVPKAKLLPMVLSLAFLFISGPESKGETSRANAVLNPSSDTPSEELFLSVENSFSQDQSLDQVESFEIKPVKVVVYRPVGLIFHPNLPHDHFSNRAPGLKPGMHSPAKTMAKHFDMKTMVVPGVGETPSRMYRFVDQYQSNSFLIPAWQAAPPWEFESYPGIEICVSPKSHAKPTCKELYFNNSETNVKAPVKGEGLSGIKRYKDFWYNKDLDGSTSRVHSVKRSKIMEMFSIKEASKYLVSYKPIFYAVDADEESWLPYTDKKMNVYLDLELTQSPEAPLFLATHSYRYQEDDDSGYAQRVEPSNVPTKNKGAIHTHYDASCKDCLTTIDNPFQRVDLYFTIKVVKGSDKKKVLF